MSSTDLSFQTALGGAIKESGKQRGIVSGTVVTLHAEICGTVHEVGEEELRLWTDLEPTELMSTLRNHALPPAVVHVRNVDIPCRFPMNSNDDVLNQLLEMFRNAFYAWDACSMVSVPVHETNPLRSTMRPSKT